MEQLNEVTGFFGDEEPPPAAPLRRHSAGKHPAKILIEHVAKRLKVPFLDLYLDFVGQLMSGRYSFRIFSEMLTADPDLPAEYYRLGNESLPPEHFNIYDPATCMKFERRCMQHLKLLLVAVRGSARDRSYHKIYDRRTSLYLENEGSSGEGGGGFRRGNFVVGEISGRRALCFPRQGSVKFDALWRYDTTRFLLKIFLVCVRASPFIPAFG